MKAAKRVLFIRLQALGDTVIAMPYIKGFAQAYPETEIYFLTRKEVEGVPKSSPFFKKVWSIGGGRNAKLMLIFALLLLPSLLVRRFDIVYDLQNNRITKVLRMLLFPRAWTALDKYSPIPAGNRFFDAIRFVGFSKFEPLYSRNLALVSLVEKRFSFINGSEKRIIVNPAGFFESRNWPHAYYFEWAAKLMKDSQDPILFVLLGVDRMTEFAEEFANKFENTVNLVNKTTVMEAYSIIQGVDFMLSEDSGLMHMAWTSGVPTLAIFGSSRSDWSRPLGPHSKLLGSEDLPCGNCLMPQCKFGDNRCLTRYTPDLVLSETQKLLNG